MKQSAARKAWLDGLRAVAMLLVIVGHLKPGKAYFIFTSPVKLPLFFAITGYLFNDERPPREFLAGLVRRLAVPWAMAVALVALAYGVFRGPAAAWSSLRGAVTEVTLWYIVCLFFAELLWYGMRRLCRGEAAAICGAALLSAAGIAMARLKVLNALMINRAFIAQAYMLIGFLFRRREDRLRGLPWGAILAGLVLYAALGCVSMRVWPNKSIDVHLNRYYNLPFNMLMIWLGCAALMAAGSRLDRSPRVLAFIGRNTLIYYMLHKYAFNGAERVLRRVGVQLSGMPRVAALTVASCAICGVASVLINRFLPELAGRRRRRAG